MTHMRHRTQIAEVRIAPHRDAGNAKRQRGAQLAERFVSPRAAGLAVRDHADCVAARNLFARKVSDMAEQAAERCPQHMQNPQRLV